MSGQMGVGVHIVIMTEGETELCFKPKLKEFIDRHLGEKPKPRLDFKVYHGRIPTKDKLRRDVENHLNDRKNKVDAVISLTDVYTGTREFSGAQDAKNKMCEWVGDNPRFYPHVALHDFEAWLLPYWATIKERAGSTKASPGTHPEKVNHDKSPARHLQEVYRTGSKKSSYIKTREAKAILEKNDLLIAANACPELKAFLNTILKLCGTEEI